MSQSQSNLVLFAAVLVVFGTALFGEFVWDDRALVVPTPPWVAP